MAKTRNKADKCYRWEMSVGVSGNGGGGVLEKWIATNGKWNAGWKALIPFKNIGWNSAIVNFQTQ